MSGCCPIISNPKGGVACGGFAKITNSWDLYQDFICYYLLGGNYNGTANEVLDLSQYHNNGTGGGGYAPSVPLQDAGVFCLTSQFFNESQLISLPTDQVRSNEAFTVSAWFNYQITYVTRNFYDRGNFQLGYTFLDQLQATIVVENTLRSTTTITVIGATSLETNEWYNVACVVDPIKETINLYLNGVLDASESLTGAIVSQGTTEIGNLFLGNVQNLTVSPVAHSTAWILAQYNNVCNYSTFLSVTAELPF
jgi:hypothetical protein